MYLYIYKRDLQKKLISVKMSSKRPVFVKKDLQTRQTKGKKGPTKSIHRLQMQGVRRLVSSSGRVKRDCWSLFANMGLL